MQKRIFSLFSVFILAVPFFCAGAALAAETGNPGTGQDISQLTPWDSPQRTPLPPIQKPAVPPAIQVPPATPYVPENRGAFNPRTGERYPSSGKGVYNPATGEYYPPSGGGYINPRTGEFYPGIDGNRP